MRYYWSILESEAQAVADAINPHYTPDPADTLFQRYTQPRNDLGNGTKWIVPFAPEYMQYLTAAQQLNVVDDPATVP